MMELLLTCPPMIELADLFKDDFSARGWNVTIPQFEQVLSEGELIDLLPGFDLWIIGDDPASAAVVQAGAAGKLKAAVKWGVGVDNVDFTAFEKAGIPVTNTPGMFGEEVADIALGYVIGLARQTFAIDRGVRNGQWPKPTGMSLAGKNVALVGFGDIGRNTAQRLKVCGMNITVYDPFLDQATAQEYGCAVAVWPEDLGQADFVVFTCALTPTNRHMLNAGVFAMCKPGVFIVNVARGPLIDESALIDAQAREIVNACALDVFEMEPPLADNPLLNHPANIVGSHNASNTRDAVIRTSRLVIEKLATFV